MKTLDQQRSVEFEGLNPEVSYRHETHMYEIPKHNKVYLFVKRGIDIFVSSLFFLMFGWLYAILLIAVILTSGFPAIYSQPRYGKSGHLFKFYKFRSMVRNSDFVLDQHLKAEPSARAQWERYQKLDHDPRITRVGQFIRKTSLDELPQFWNVLVGDMTLIGPRPCMANQKDLFGPAWHYYCAMRPGITGLWQVSGRNNLTFQRRVELDVDYVKRASLMFDFKIIARTVWVVLSGHGSR